VATKNFEQAARIMIADIRDGGRDGTAGTTASVLDQ
jgi:hypothetical protein